MGSDTDGPSIAAQGVPAEEGDRSGPRGLLGRILGAFTQGEPRPSDDAASKTSAAEARPPAGEAGILNLRRLRVDDVAIPKAEIQAVPVEVARDVLVEAFRRSGNSRLPVYEGTLDHPLGLVHLKDFALTHGFGQGGGGAFDVRPLLRPLLYVPPSMPIGVLLSKMQSERIHMALVIDEFGGVDGLLTIEDLVEQVLGEIEDEHDIVSEGLWREEKPGSYVVLAKTPLDAFEAETGLHFALPDAEDDPDTLGGLVFLMAGRVPARGAVIAHPSGASFEVLDADPRRINRLRVRLPEDASRTGPRGGAAEGARNRARTGAA